MTYPPYPLISQCCNAQYGTLVQAARDLISMIKYVAPNMALRVMDRAMQVSMPRPNHYLLAWQRVY